MARGVLGDLVGSFDESAPYGMTSGRIMSCSSCSRMWQCQTYSWPPVLGLAGTVNGTDGRSKRMITHVTSAGFMRTVSLLVVLGLLRGATRPAVTLETAGLLIYGATTIVTLLLAPQVGLVVVALTLVAHALWDVWHLRRHRDVVSPSLAEACVALDVPAGLAVLVAALA